MPAVPGLFDIRTFLFSIILIEIFLSVMMLLYARSRGGYPGFSTWALQMAMLACGQICGALRGFIPDGISILGSGFFNTLGVLLIYESLSRFYTGRILDRRWYLLIPLLLCGIWYWYAIDDSLAYRTVLISATYGFIVILATRTIFWENTTGEKGFTALLGIIYLILAIIFVERAVDYLVNPVGRELLESSFVNSVFYLYILVAAIGATFLFLILNVERKTRELDESHLQLERLANRYDLAITSAGAGVWEVDQKSGRMVIDTRIIRMFGGEGPGLPGMDAWIQSRVFPEDWERLTTRVRSITHQGNEISEEYRIVMDTGEVRYHLVHARGFQSEEGDGLRVIGLSTDITPLRKAQNALSTAMRKISILSQITRHDILNCVTVIGLTARMVQDDIETTSPSYRRLTIIGDMGEQINRLISFTREYEELGQTEPLWSDPSAILGKESVRALLGPVTLHLPKPGIEIYADQMIEKVFYNLVDNSIRHGGRVQNISLTYQHADDDLLIWYSDDGNGISQEKKELIFSQGFGENTGMGLFLCREILAITGLTIKETGSEDSGARFEIRAGPGLFRDRDLNQSAR